MKNKYYLRDNIPMVSTVMHLVWSLALSRLMGIKNVLRFLFLGIFLDFDFLFYSAGLSTDHRIYFHNIFFISVTLMLIFFTASKAQKYHELFKSASAAFSLHMLLDFFDGFGVPLFYPLSSERILIYPVGQPYEFPLKLFWEGNIYFTIASFAILAAVLCYCRNPAKLRASRI